MSLPIGPRPPAVQLMTGLGLDPDPWQLEVLEGKHPRLLLNCCRQAGKSTVVAMLALAETVWAGGTRVLLVSRSQRQSEELFRIMTDAYRRLGRLMEVRLTAHEMELENQSRVVCLPCREDTIRGYANVSLLVIDEAARVPDAIYRAVRPMLAVSGGRLICRSTPFGKRGFFYDAWARGGGAGSAQPQAAVPVNPESPRSHSRRTTSTAAPGDRESPGADRRRAGGRWSR